jgi:flagellar biosynthesis protein FliP
MRMIALLTELSLAPSILVMMTSFTASCARRSVPRPRHRISLIVSLAVFLTAFKMGRCNALTTLASGL